MARLAQPRLLMKREGQDWCFSSGCVVGQLALMVPTSKITKGGQVMYKLDVDKPVYFESVLDLEKFKAMPFLPIGPMHQAIIVEAGTCKTDVITTLEEYEAYGDLPVAAMPTDKARKLLECMTREAFMDLLVSYIKQVLEYSGHDCKSTELKDVLIEAFAVGIPESKQTPELLLKILEKRKHWHERSRAHDPVVEMEWVLDCFDREERKSLEIEIRDSKNSREGHKRYQQDVFVHKVIDL